MERATELLARVRQDSEIRTALAAAKQLALTEAEARARTDPKFAIYWCPERPRPRGIIVRCAVPCRFASPCRCAVTGSAMWP